MSTSQRTCGIRIRSRVWVETEVDNELHSKAYSLCVMSFKTLFLVYVRRDIMLQSARYDVALEDYNRYLVATLEKFDQEKQLVIAKIDELAKDQDALKDLREVVAKQSNEILKYQQDLSEHRLMLQEEREKVARLMNENAVLVAQGEDDREKIASLIRMRRTELSQRADEEASSFPMRVSIMRPGATQPKRGEPQSMSLRSVVTDYAGAKVHITKPSAHTIDSLIQPPPSSALVTALSREIEGLKLQVDSQRRAYENDRAIRVCEERDRHHAQEETLRKYAATIDHLQALQNETTRDLVTYRHNAQIKERNLYGEIEVLRNAVEEARAQLHRERNTQTAGIQMAIQSADTRHQDVVHSLRQEIEDRTRGFRLEKDALLTRIEELTNELDKAHQKALRDKRSKKRLQEQHKLENEGLQTEIHLMKQHLRAVEKKIYFTQARAQDERATV